MIEPLLAIQPKGLCYKAALKTYDLARVISPSFTVFLLNLFLLASIEST